MRSPALLPLLIAVVLVPLPAATGPNATGPNATSSDSAPVSEAAAVVGTVRVVAPPQDPPAPLSPYARRRPTPPQEPGIAGGSSDAFVYLERLSSPGGATATVHPDTTARIVQRDRMILPHSTAVHAGQPVQFPNDDDVFHNLFSLSPGNRFSLGRYAPGVSPTHTFDEPGVVRLFCDIHAEMAGVVLVVDTPWVVRVDDDGSYSLGGLPGGSYRAIAWHPTAGADTTRVEVADDEVAQVDFVLAPAR